MPTEERQELRDAIARFEQKIDTVREQVGAIQIAQAEESARRDSVNQRVDGIERAVARTEGEQARLAERLTRIEADRVNKLEHAAALEPLRAVDSQLSTSINALRQEVGRRHDELKTMLQQAKTDRVQEELAERDRRIQELDTQRQKAEADKAAALAKAAADQESKVKELTLEAQRQRLARQRQVIYGTIGVAGGSALLTLIFEVVKHFFFK